MPLISYHNQIETQIENFVENFKKNGSVLISTLNVESYGSTLREGFTQWTPSDDSATDYPRTSAGCSSYDSSCSDSCSCDEGGNSDNGYDDCGNPTPTKYALLARVKENLVKLLLLSTEYATSVHLLFFSELCRNQFLLSPCPASHLAPRQTFEFGFCAKRDRCSATGNCQNWLNAVVSRALMLFCDVLQLDRALCHRQVFCKRFTR